MAFTDIPGNPNWEYDNDPPDPGGALSTLWATGTDGIRTNQSGDEIYMNVRHKTLHAGRASVPSEMSKTFWDRFAPSYNSNAQAYFDAVEAAGGSFDLSSLDATYTEAYVKNAHNDLFESLDTYWSQIGQFIINCGKTGAGINIVAKGVDVYTANYTSGNYNPVKTGSTPLGLNVNSNLAQTFLSASANETVLPVINKENYSLSTIATSTGYNVPNYAYRFSEVYPSATQISGDIQFDKLQYFIGDGASSSSITYFNYGQTGFLEYTKYQGQAKIRRNGTDVASSSYFTTTYAAAGSQGAGINWTFNSSPNSYSGRFAIHMSYTPTTSWSGVVPSAIKDAFKTFINALGDTTTIP